MFVFSLKDLKTKSPFKLSKDITGKLCSNHSILIDLGNEAVPFKTLQDLLFPIFENFDYSDVKNKIIFKNSPSNTKKLIGNIVESYFEQ